MATSKARTNRVEAPRSDLVEKEPSQLHNDFTAWLADQTGYEVDSKTVQLATILRMDFQRSEVNQARLQGAKDAKAAQAEERAAKRQARAEARAAKDAAAAAKKSADPASAGLKLVKSNPATKTATAPAKSTAASRRSTGGTTKTSAASTKASPRRRSTATSKTAAESF